MIPRYRRKSQSAAARGTMQHNALMLDIYKWQAHVQAHYGIEACWLRLTRSGFAGAGLLEHPNANQLR
jgi:hypothetical protein